MILNKPANVVYAMQALESYRLTDLRSYNNAYKIGINSVGSRFEEYIKDLLTGQFYQNDPQRDAALSNNYAWLGNPNFPPDAIARGGDAFEIKKHEGAPSIIALNSSPPRDKLYSDDSRITEDCRNSMGSGRNSVDLFYIVGSVKGGIVNNIYFVQGTCYAARRDIYNNIEKRVSNAIRQSIQNQGISLSKTKEIARVNNADPLGRASLRIRGMWQIKHPAVAFSQIAPPEPEKDFFAYAIMEKEKYETIGIVPNDSNYRIQVKDKKCQDPNNGAEFKEAVVMEVSW